METGYSFEKLMESGTLFSLEDGNLLIAWGARQWISDPSERSKHIPCFYFPDFFLRHKTPWFVQQHWKTISIPELLDSLPQFQEKIRMPQWENTHQVYFHETFENLQRLIDQKKIIKAVPYVCEKSSDTMDVCQLGRSLSSVLQYALHQPLFLYGFWNEEEGILGASPEFLFQYKKAGNLKTVACAGTRAKSAEGASLLTDEKELLEHHLVIEGITESLRPFGSVLKEKTSILSLPTLSHLITPLQVELKKAFDFESIVKALHPTPALGVLPRPYGDAWLQEYERGIQRKRYGAPAGCIFPEEESCCYVAIRNVQWDRDGMMIGAGCGVVSGSCLNNEWQEVNLKIRTIKEMMKL